MEILELNFERTWRGGERQTLYNMSGFRDAGIQVSLLCRKGYPLEAKAKAAGFTVHSFGNIFQVLLFFMFRCRQYAVLHAQTSHILTWCLLTRPFHSAKVIFTRRVDFVPHGALTRMKYRAADNLVAISNAVKEIVERFSGKKVAVISDVVVAKTLDRQRAEQMLKDAGMQQGKLVLGTTAAYVPHKDPLNMVEAIKLLAGKRNDFIFLHFGTGELEADVRNKIQEYGLQDVYKMMGFYDNVEDIFSALDLFVMSSQEEGLGSSVLDAFIYKVPVVSTDAGGLKDLVKEGRAVMCPKNNAAALAAGMEQLMNDTEQGERNAALAYEYVMKYHSQSYITQQYLDLINAVK